MALYEMSGALHYYFVAVSKHLGGGREVIPDDAYGKTAVMGNSTPICVSGHKYLI